MHVLAYQFMLSILHFLSRPLYRALKNIRYLVPKSQEKMIARRNKRKRSKKIGALDLDHELLSSFAKEIVKEQHDVLIVERKWP